MKTYSFNIFADGRGADEIDFVSRFLDLGCADTAVSFQNGMVVFEFARQARSLTDALVSAMADLDAADVATCR